MKYAVVTGAGSGLGKDCCNDLLNRGWMVFALDNSTEGLQAVVAEFGESGSRVVPIVCDVSDSASVTRAFEAIRAYTAAVHALICSAGILRTGPLLEMREADFDAVFAVNTKGGWLTARAALPLLEAGVGETSPARIVFVASLAAIRPKVGAGAYSASKVALTQMTRVLAVELAPKGILVNAVAPSTVDTPMTRQLLVGRETSSYKVSGISPLGRVADAADVTSVIRFLLSDETSFITGTILPIDGGISAAYQPR